MLPLPVWKCDVHSCHPQLWQLVVLLKWSPLLWWLSAVPRVCCHSSTASASLLWAHYISLHWLGWSHGGNTSAHLMFLVFLLRSRLKIRYLVGCDKSCEPSSLSYARTGYMWNNSLLLPLHRHLWSFMCSSCSLNEIIQNLPAKYSFCAVSVVCFRCFLALHHNLEVLS